MSDVSSTFAAWLKTERTAAGMSQQKVADRLKAKGHIITQSQIAKIERGERLSMPLDLLVAIAEVFGTTPDVALGLSSNDRTEAVRSLQLAFGRRTAALYELRDVINAELGAER